MSTVWKVLIGLALVVPMGAYVVGSLAASAADDPAPRHTITIREPDPSHSPSGSPTRSPTHSPSHSPSPEGDDDDVEVITPEYDDLDDDHGDDHGSDDHGGDRGGDDHGGGEDHSGHGGGDD